MNNMTDTKYVYYVQCVIASNSWLSKFLITCSNVDRILPILREAGLDNVTAYGEPKEPKIKVHYIQRLAQCRQDPPESIVEMHRMYCDINPNTSF